MRVFVYRNLVKGLRGGRPMFSVQSRERGWNYGRVVDHVYDVCLADCTFVVQPAGYRRVLTTGVKNVHAGIVGWLTHDTFDDFDKVTYDPRIAGYFRDEKGVAVYRAERVLISSREVENHWVSLIRVKNAS